MKWSAPVVISDRRRPRNSSAVRKRLVPRSCWPSSRSRSGTRSARRGRTGARRRRRPNRRAWRSRADRL